MDAANYILHLYDPSEEKTYSITLSKEDYERALRDLNFAQRLLNAARVEEPVPGPSSEYTDDVSCAQPSNNSSVTNQAGFIDVNENIRENIEESVPPDPEIDDDSLSEHEHRTVWSYNATVALISSMETHFEDLNHATKRKHVFSNISNDLGSAGHLFDAPACQRKWKSLVRTYKSAKDHKVKTGRGPTRFLFFDLMDSILGDKPVNKCEHTMESSNPQTQNPVNEETSENTNEKTDEEVLAKKRKKKPESCAKVRSEADKKKEERHRERMELEARKIAIEERKIALLEQLVQKK